MSGNEKVVADFATLDLDRLKRRGVGEVIFGEGKEAEEIALIMEALIERQGRALTRIRRCKHSRASTQRRRREKYQCPAHGTGHVSRGTVANRTRELHTTRWARLTWS